MIKQNSPVLTTQLIGSSGRKPVVTIGCSNADSAEPAFYTAIESNI